MNTPYSMLFMASRYPLHIYGRCGSLIVHCWLYCKTYSKFPACRNLAREHSVLSGRCGNFTWANEHEEVTFSDFFHCCTMVRKTSTLSNSTYIMPSLWIQRRWHTISWKWSTSNLHYIWIVSECSFTVHLMAHQCLLYRVELCPLLGGW